MLYDGCTLYIVQVTRVDKRHEKIKLYPQTNSAYPQQFKSRFQRNSPMLLIDCNNLEEIKDTLITHVPLNHFLPDPLPLIDQ